MNFPPLLLQSFKRKKRKGSALNSLFVRCCACSPWGEATLLFHQIKWSEAVPFQEEPIKVFKEVYYCDGLWNHSHRIHRGVCFNRSVNVCTLPLRKLIKLKKKKKKKKRCWLELSICTVNRKLEYAVTALHVLQETFPKLNLGWK